MLEPETVLVQLISNAYVYASITLTVHWFIIILEYDGDVYIVSLFQTYFFNIFFLLINSSLYIAFHELYNGTCDNKVSTYRKDNTDSLMSASIYILTL